MSKKITDYPTKQVGIDQYIREKGGQIEVVSEHTKGVHVKPTLSASRQKAIKSGKTRQLFESSEGGIRTAEDVIEEWINDPTRTEIAGLSSREDKLKFLSYYGTKPPNTIKAIALDREIPLEQKGIAVELSEGYNAIAKDIRNIEAWGLNLMVDNGSFKYSQRCAIFNGDLKDIDKKIDDAYEENNIKKAQSLEKKKKNMLTPEEYFNYDNAEKQSEFIVKQYELALKNSKDPRNFSIIVPELIGSSEITQKLHKKYVKKFKELEDKYGCSVWISLQFNPHSEEWRDEVLQSIKAIDRLDIPDDWKIGVPYGKDFKLLYSTKDALHNRRFLFNEIKKEFYENKVHLYGCGTINKIEDIKPYRDLVTSIDSSSANVWSRFSHYLSSISNTQLDIRLLTRKKGTKETQDAEIELFEKSTNIPLEVWIAGRKDERYRDWFPMLAKFIVNLQTFNTYLDENILIKNRTRPELKEELKEEMVNALQLKSDVDKIKTYRITEETIQKKFKEDTGKNAIWRDNYTRGFRDWVKKHNYSKALLEEELFGVEKRIELIERELGIKERKFVAPKEDIPIQPKKEIII